MLEILVTAGVTWVDLFRLDEVVLFPANTLPLRVDIAVLVPIYF